MIAVVVALVAQVAWDAVRAVLEQTGIAAHNAHVAGMAFGLGVATNLVIAGGLASVAERHDGTGRTGLRIAAVAYLMVAICLPVRDGLVHCSWDYSAVRQCVYTMNAYGWSGLEVIAAVGIALAAGRRGQWLAPLAIGFAVLGGRPKRFDEVAQQVEAIAFVAAKVVVLVLMMIAAERRAIPPSASDERAARGLRRAEILALAFALLSVVRIALPLDIRAVDLVYAIVAHITEIVLACTIWSVARANVLPRWPLYASAMCTLWTVARAVRIWFLLLTSTSTASTGAPSWTMAVPSLLATAYAMLALVVVARRPSIVALGLVILTMAMRIAIPTESIAIASCYLALNIAAARSYHSAREAIGDALPRARVV